MPEVYPCRVVIANDSEFARQYNDDPENALIASYCLTVDEAYLLFKDKRKIETIVLVNGEAEELMCWLSGHSKLDTKNSPDVVRVDVPPNYETASLVIRNAIYASSILFLWAG